MREGTEGGKESVGVSAREKERAIERERGDEGEGGREGGRNRQRERGRETDRQREQKSTKSQRKANCTWKVVLFVYLSVRVYINNWIDVSIHRFIQ